MKTLRIAIYGSILLLGSYAAQAQISLSSSTANWRPILLANGVIDPYNDLQAQNPAADIVGSSTTPGAYWQFYGGGHFVHHRRRTGVPGTP